jgi:endonuclease YncB( thermonuclease family)
MTDYLDNINYHDTIPFIPPLTCGKVIKVYDGDTLTIASKLPYEGCPIYRFSVRINGIDCPEMRTKNQNEKTCAKMAKAKVYDAVFGKIVTLQNVKLEKYGRVLADVYIGDVSLGDMLCQYNLAVKYDGGTKHVPIDWLEYYNEQNTQSTTPIQTEQAQQTL